jgi:hypothetical protein
MGARLRRCVKEKTGTKSHDSKPLGGKDCLTQSEIDKLQNYYALAIKQNVNNLEAMKRAVWAITFHKLSTKEKPQHGLCTSGDDSWCKFKNSASSGLAYEHKHSLPAAVMDAIKPVFRGLASVDLLKRCLQGKTLNPNKSLNSILWTIIPKTVFVRLDTLKFGVYDAVLCFSDGVPKKNDVLNILGVRSGSNTVNALKQTDVERDGNTEHLKRSKKKEKGTKKKRRSTRSR